LHSALAGSAFIEPSFTVVVTMKQNFGIRFCGRRRPA
jgi:hypothetical protein